MRRASQFMATMAGRYPWGLLIASAALAAASSYYAAHRLRFTSDRDLVEHDPAVCAKKAEYNAQFRSPSYALVLFAGAPAENADSLPAPSKEVRREMKSAAREFAEWARTRRAEYETVIERLDPSQFGDLGLLYMDYEDLAALEGRLQAARPILVNAAKAPSLAGLFAAVNDQWDALTTRPAPVASGPPGEAPNPPAAPPLAELSSVVDACAAAAKGARYDGPSISTLLLGGEGEGDLDPEGYLFRGKGRYSMVLIDPNTDKTALNPIERPLALAHEEVRQVLLRHPGLHAGITGSPVLEAEEMDTSVSDFQRSTIGTFVGIVALLAINFRRMVRPLLTMLPLLLAIAWTLGATTLVIGKMNLLAMVFAIILIAMGIDYGIVIVAHYERGLRAGLSPVAALAAAFRTAGVGLVTSCLASAIVFFSAAFTRYRGFAELGVIAGMGLLLCLVAMTTTLPAILVLVDRWRRPRAEAEPPDPPARPRARGLQSALAVLLVAGAAAACWVGRRLDWSFSLLDLQPRDVESMRWIRPLLEGDRPPLEAISLARDRAELERLSSRFRALPQVRAVQSVFPDREEEKRAILARLREWMAGVVPGPRPPFNMRKLLLQTMRFRTNLRDVCERSSEARDALGPLVESLGRLTSALRPDDDAMTRRIDRLDEEASRSLASGIELLRKMVDPGPVMPERLPPLLREDFVGNRGLLALKVCPKKNIWSWPALPHFVSAVRSVDPNAIGAAIELCDSSFAIQQSFRVSVAIALAAVLLLLAVTFRSVLPMLVGFFPMMVALALLAALMVKTGRSLNFANYFAVPILLGSALEYSLHLVQSFRMGAGSRLLGSTRWAVLLCALSTLLGFASLVPARHRGVASLGWVLTIGTILAYGSAMVLVPVAMRWLRAERTP